MALFDEVAFEDDDMLADGNAVFLLGARLQVLDDDAALAPDTRPEIHNAVDLRDLGSVLGMAGFEQLGHPRQTAGDVFGLGCFAGGLGHQRAGHDLVPFVHHDVGARRDRVTGDGVIPLVQDDDLRV